MECDMTKVDAERPGDNPEATSPALPVLLEHHARFLAFLTSRVGHIQTAEEILQTALARIIERDPLVDEENVSAWFYRVLRNAIADYYRRQAAESRALDAWRTEQTGLKDDDDLQRTACACLGELIPRLKPEYAELLARVELGGESLQEAAKSLAITPNNASVRLHRARQALKQQLEATCRACATHGCLDCTCQES
jgi:RNA polymerase sigma-70 factor (ECF subfamily)